jgi:hypothetical protein
LNSEPANPGPGTINIIGGMFMKRLGLSVFAALISFPFTAQAGGFATIKAGFGSIDVNPEYAIEDRIPDDGDVFSMGTFAGYNFGSGLVVEGGLSAEISEDIFESYDVFQWIGMLGYIFRPGKDFTFVPKFGFSMWELNTYDSGFLDFFGDGAEEHTYDGTDPIWSLEGEYSLNKLIQFNLSYTQGGYGFGDLDSFRFGVEFDF